MLKEILSITGKSGLYKKISQGKNMLIVESLLDGKRIPAYSYDKIVSLADISVFTQTDNVQLGEVLEKIKIKENSALVTLNPKAGNDDLRNYLAEVLPDYDRDRVYPSDIRKMINWYNILINSNITEFLEVEEEEEKATEEKKEKATEAEEETPKV
jgi:hypothetical protein